MQGVTGSEEAAMAASGDDHYLVERLRERFAEDPRLGELGIEVHIVAGIVHIHGEVATEQRRAAIGEIAAEVAPDRAVRNEVQVTEIGAGPAAEVLG